MSATAPALPRRAGAPVHHGRLRSLVRRRPADPAWVRPALLGVVALAAVLCLWDLTISGYANSYYAAAVRSASESWKAMFFGSLDPGSFITVDKPPLSLWLMGLSARVLGFSSLSLLLRGPLGAAGANAVGLALTAVGNTAANRRLTFGVRGRTGLVRQHLAGFLVFLLTLGLTSGALAVLHGLVADPPRALELVVLIAASAVATVTRYVALRSWVFARARRAPPPAPLDAPVLQRAGH